MHLCAKFGFEPLKGSRPQRVRTLLVKILQIWVELGPMNIEAAIESAFSPMPDIIKKLPNMFSSDIIGFVCNLNNPYRNTILEWYRNGLNMWKETNQHEKYLNRIHRGKNGIWETMYIKYNNLDGILLLLQTPWAANETVLAIEEGAIAYFKGLEILQDSRQFSSKSITTIWERAS